jgi:hypothetical protein
MMLTSVGKQCIKIIKVLFRGVRSVVAIAFWNIFYSEMYQNNHLKKIIFEINTLKQSKNIKKIILSKNKFEFLGNNVSTVFSNNYLALYLFRKKKLTKPVNQGNRGYFTKLAYRVIDSIKFNNPIFSKSFFI